MSEARSDACTRPRISDRRRRPVAWSLERIGGLDGRRSIGVSSRTGLCRAIAERTRRGDRLLARNSRPLGGRVAEPPAACGVRWPVVVLAESAEEQFESAVVSEAWAVVARDVSSALIWRVILAALVAGCGSPRDSAASDRLQTWLHVQWDTLAGGTAPAASNSSPWARIQHTACCGFEHDDCTCATSAASRRAARRRPRSPRPWAPGRRSA